MKPSQNGNDAIRMAFRGLDRKALAEDLNTSVNVINQYANGSKIPSARRAIDIEKATKQKVLARLLRPDIFS